MISDLGFILVRDAIRKCAGNIYSWLVGTPAAYDIAPCKTQVV